MQKREIVGIQYLRGIASVAVVFDHAAGMTAFPKYFGTMIAGGALLAGKYGVDIFFVISGFIITIVALKGKELVSVQTPKIFFLKRFVRIVPLMWVAVLSYFLLRNAFTTETKGLAPYLRAFFLIPYGDVDPDSIWTLRHEAIFYSVFALSFLTLPKMRWLLGAWFISPVALFLGQWIGCFTIAADSPFDILFSRYNLEFAAGFLVGTRHLRRTDGAEIAPVVHPFIVLSGLAIVVMGLGLAAKGMISPLLEAALMAVSGGLLIALAAKLRCPSDRLASFGLMLGSASFSIYLFHLHVESALLTILARVVPSLNPVAVVIVVSVAAILAGIVAHYLLEKKLVRFCQELLMPARTRRAATSTC